MTIQEQLEKLNDTFEKLHRNFDSLTSEKENLDSKYTSIIAAIKSKYQQEKDKLIQLQEEVLTYYRIAKDNSYKELVHSGINPLKPNISKLNIMIERVESYSRNETGKK